MQVATVWQRPLFRITLILLALKKKKKWSRCCFVAPQDETNKFWESLSTGVSSVALMFPILQFAVKMSVNLAASQTPRFSVSASDNLRTECAHLIDLKWRIQVTLLRKRQLKASLGWVLFVDVRPRSRSGPCNLSKTGRYFEKQSAWKSLSEPRSVGTGREWRLQRGKAIILAATSSVGLSA